MLRKTLVYGTGLCLSGLLLLLSFLFWGSSSYNAAIPEKSIKMVVEAVRGAKNLPDTFYSVFHKIEKVGSTGDFLFATAFNRNQVFCPCLQVAKRHLAPTPNKNRLLQNHYFAALRLEKELSQKECLNYLVANTDFLYQAIGVQQAAQTYFHKNLSELSQREMATLILMMRNPLAYNPLINPEIMERLLERHYRD